MGRRSESEMESVVSGEESVGVVMCFVRDRSPLTSLHRTTTESREYYLIGLPYPKPINCLPHSLNPFSCASSRPRPRPPLRLLARRARAGPEAAWGGMSSSCSGLMRTFVECMRHSSCVKVRVSSSSRRRARDSLCRSRFCPPPTKTKTTGRGKDRDRVLGKLPDRVPAPAIRPLCVPARPGRRAHANPGKQR